MRRDWDKWITRIEIKYSLGYGNSRCPICDRLLVGQSWDLHEALFTRGSLRSVRWQKDIFHQYNSIGVCHGPCHIRATSAAGKLKCATALIKRYGYREILDWINHLPFKHEKNKIPAISLLKEANHGIEKERAN